MTGLPAAVLEAVRQSHRIAARTTLWPGWRPAATPLALHREGEAWLIAHPSPPAGYQRVGEVDGLPVLRGPRLPEMAANTAAPIAGAITALVTLPDQPPADVERYARLILHERFHAHQGEALSHLLPPGLNMVRLMSEYPENDPVNNAMAVVENRLLATALGALPPAAPDPATGPRAGAQPEAAPGAPSPQPARQAAARFLSVRRARHARLADELTTYEQTFEYSEGTATYIEARAGLPIAEIIQALHQASVGGKWAAMRRFNYTGAALALLLDRLQPGWQERLAAGGHTLQSLLQDAVDGPLPSAEDVLAQEGYPELLTAEEAHEQERQQRVQALLRELMEGPGLLVEILRPQPSGVLFDPRNFLVVRPGVRLHTRMSGLITPWCRVEVTRLCLEEPDRLLLRLPAEPPVTNEGGFRIQVDGLQATAPAGRVEWEGDRLRIHLLEA